MPLLFELMQVALGNRQELHCVLSAQEWNDTFEEYVRQSPITIFGRCVGDLTVIEIDEVCGDGDHYPSEVMWTPIWLVYHKLWKWNKVRKIRSARIDHIMSR